MCMKPNVKCHQIEISITILNKDMKKLYENNDEFRLKLQTVSTGDKVRLNAWGYDGKTLRGPFSFVGNLKSIDELSSGIGNVIPNCDAYFLGSKGKMVLFMLDGNKLSKPIPFGNVSFNEHPANDWSFMRDLPDKIDALRDKKMGYSRSVQSIKVWINVENGSVIKFPTTYSFDKAIHNQPEKFNIPDGSTLLQARLAAEKAGWVAFGINAENKNNVVAVTQAMTVQQARKATKAMWDVKKGPWNKLMVVTNNGKETFDGEDAIKAFIDNVQYID